MNLTRKLSPLGLVICLASWLSMSTLLMSPTLAQVHGPGPSPANLFDTVLNLPGDESIITRAEDESNGGVAGQTVQLNVNDGGEVGWKYHDFDANAGSEVNISGGNGGRCFSANAGSEVNVSGGLLNSLIATEIRYAQDGVKVRGSSYAEFLEE